MMYSLGRSREQSELYVRLFALLRETGNICQNIGSPFTQVHDIVKKKNNKRHSLQHADNKKHHVFLCVCKMINMSKYNVI